MEKHHEIYDTVTNVQNFWLFEVVDQSVIWLIFDDMLKCKSVFNLLLLLNSRC